LLFSSRLAVVSSEELNSDIRVNPCQLLGYLEHLLQPARQIHRAARLRSLRKHAHTTAKTRWIPQGPFMDGFSCLPQGTEKPIPPGFGDNIKAAS
ncbi:hypothetical protein, partial [Azohydromonas lata]